MLRSPHFRRLFVPYVILALAGTVLIAMWGASRIRATYLDRTRTSLLHEAQLVGRLIETRRTTHGAAVVQQQVVELGQLIRKRITFLDPDGSIVADSAQEPHLVDRRLMRFEMQRSLTDDFGFEVRHSEPLDLDLIYFAIRLGTTEDPRGVVRLAIDLSDLDAEIRDFYRDLTIGAAVGFLLIIGICYVIVRKTARPLVDLTAAANTLAEGQLDYRINVDDAGEIGTLARSINRLADSLGGLIDRIAKDKEELRAVLGSMAEGVIAVGPDDIVTVANEAAARFFGFDLDTAKDRDFNEIIRHPDVLQLARRVVKDREIAQLQVGPTAGALDLYIVICPVVKESGGIVIIAHDIAESHRYQQLRTEFVANVSHELRTPLTMIRGFVETLRHSSAIDPETHDNFLEKIERNVLQLANLIDDLLQLSELQERQGGVERQPVNLDAVVSNVVETLRPLAENKGQKLKVQSSHTVPPVLGNPWDLERVIANLLDNAIKYTDDGGWITLIIGREDPHVVVRVEDTGLGIPAEDLPRIFERFYRVDKSRSRAMGGTGLGLAIAKHVIQAHGGTIDVSSKIGQGSRFTVRLPIYNRSPGSTTPV